MEVPADWPEGSVVLIRPTADVPDESPAGDWPTTPEAIAERLRLMDAVEPFLAPAEEEAWLRDMAERKAHELAAQREQTRPEVGGTG